MAFRPRDIVIFFLSLALVLSACSDHRAVFKGKPRKIAQKQKKKKTAHAKPARQYTGKIQPGDFIWPVDGPVNSSYGERWGRSHDGIDIGVDQGDPVSAAAGGKVVYSARLGGYGNLIVIQHPSGLFTAYAHNKKNLVRKGERVKQGQRIARLGRTGNATGDHLHFEIRDQAGTYDPVDFLSKERIAARPRSLEAEPPVIGEGEKPQIQVAGGGPDRLDALPAEAMPSAIRSEALPAAPPSPVEPEAPEDKMMELLSDI
jgi:hypothetical protein